MTFHEAFVNDPVVYHMVKDGASLESIIVALVERHEQMIKKFIELESIVPKKFLMEDGSIKIWNCPTDLIPVRKCIPFPNK